MEILDDIKAKRENVQNSQYCESCDNSLAGMPCTCFETIEHNAAYAIRMDPRTVEAMENVCRAAENFVLDADIPDKWVAFCEALKALSQIDK